MSQLSPRPERPSCGAARGGRCCVAGPGCRSVRAAASRRSGTVPAPTWIAEPVARCASVVERRRRVVVRLIADHGNSVTQIDGTHGHLVPDSEEYLRGLRDAYDSTVPEQVCFGGTMPAARTPGALVSLLVSLAGRLLSLSSGLPGNRTVYPDCRRGHAESSSAMSLPCRTSWVRVPIIRFTKGGRGVFVF